MKTYFALHCITKRNKDDHTFDEELEELGYNETDFKKEMKKRGYSAAEIKEQLPSAIDIAQGQIDEPLIEKGKWQAKFLGKQIKNKHQKIERIYCGKQKRCQETARIIAKEIGLPEENIVCDKRIDARNYGIIAEQNMETAKLKHFVKYEIFDMFKNIALYLFAPEKINAEKEIDFNALKNIVKSDFDTLKTIVLYLVAPEKIGAEKKSNFVSRIKSFIHDKKNNFDNAVIVAGSDFWKVVKEENYFYKYKNEDKRDLMRGQIANIDFSAVKEQKTISPKKNKVNDMPFEL